MGLMAIYAVRGLLMSMNATKRADLNRHQRQ